MKNIYKRLIKNDNTFDNTFVVEYGDNIDLEDLKNEKTPF